MMRTPGKRSDPLTKLPGDTSHTLWGQQRRPGRAAGWGLAVAVLPLGLRRRSLPRGPGCCGSPPAAAASVSLQPGRAVKDTEEGMEVVWAPVCGGSP